MKPVERDVFGRFREVVGPPSDLREKTFARIESEREEAERIEELRMQSFSHLEESGLIGFLQKLRVKVDGSIHGRDFFEDKVDVVVPQEDETYPLIIPLSEESVVLTVLWGKKKVPDSNVHGAKTITVEAFPNGDIFVFGNSIWGTSHSSLKDREEDPSLGKKMMVKAYKAPGIVHYVLPDDGPRLIYGYFNPEEKSLF